MFSLFSKSINFRSNSLISCFLVRISVSLTLWSKVTGLFGLPLLGSSRLEWYRNSYLSFLEPKELLGMADASSNYRSSSSWICDNFSLEVEYFILKIIKAITVSMHHHSIYFPIIFSRSFIPLPTLLQDELPLSKNTLLHYK